MRGMATYAGRSMVFNVIFVLLNIAGLTLVVLGNHSAFIESALLLNLIGTGVMLLSIAGLVLFRGRLLMSGFSRVLVGGLFIVSGLVKANDPLGFSYKLEEYFQDGALAYRIKELFGAPAFSLEFLMDSALAISVLICIVEIVLGVLTVIGGKIKLVSYLLLGMMLFFTFLTWHTANCDPEAKFVDRNTYALSDPLAKQKLEEAKEKKVVIVSKTSTELVVDEMKTPQCVTDCGCFGDALKGSVGRSLTPNESMWKDLVLLYFVCWIFVAQWIIRPNTAKENFRFAFTSILMITFFSWVFDWYFPIFFGLISIFGALWIRRAGGKYLGNYLGSILVLIILSSLLVGFVLRYDPIRDYRPYAVGSNLKWKMTDGVKGVYEDALLYRNKKTGEERIYASSSSDYSNSKIWELKDWEFIEMTSKVIKAGVNPSIMDFTPLISFADLTNAERNLPFVKAMLINSKVKLIRLRALEDKTIEEVLLADFNRTIYPTEEYQILDTIEVNNPELSDIEIKDALIGEKRVVILISRNLNEANWSSMQRIKSIAKKCEARKVPFLMITNGSRTDIDAFRKKNNFNYGIFSMDEIELKIVSRSNPALLVLEKGVVTEKYSHRTIPTGDRFKQIHLK